MSGGDWGEFHYIVLGRAADVLPNSCEGLCSFSGSSGSSRTTPPRLSRGKGWGRGRAITCLQQKLQEGFAVGGLPVEIWRRHCSVHRAMETAGWRVVSLHPATSGWWWRTAGPAEQMSLSTKTLCKVLEIFPPLLFSLGKDQKANSSAKNMETPMPAFPL